MTITRRTFLEAAAVTGSAAALGLTAGPGRDAAAADEAGFAFKYLLPSCMYGYTDLAAIVPEAAKIGATGIDIWPKVHGNQREQLDEMGEAAFGDLLAKHGVDLSCITQYKLGPLGLTDEMPLARRLGCRTIVTGGKGPKGLTGTELKAAVGDFAELMKPHVALAEEHGVTIAIENHGNGLIESPDSLRYLRDLRPSKNLAIALAPYHLPQDAELLAGLIRDLGDSIAMFYAWQHGTGSHTAQPKEDELKQLPGRGDLDFAPLVAALREIRYAGWTEIFMHPFPRGVAILETTDAVTAEINRARRYLDGCIRS